MKKQQGQGRAAHRRTRQQTMAQVWKCRWLYLMMLPVVVYFIVFKYIPMYGITIAFQDYNIFKIIYPEQHITFHRQLRSVKEHSIPINYTYTLVF